MILHQELKYIKSVNGLDYYLFQPSFNNWFFHDWKGYKEDTEKQTIRQWIRMLIEYMWGGGYYIYYVAQNKSIIGYILISNGGRRVTCSNINDVVLGPYYTLKEQRGKGIASKMIDSALHDFNISYKNAYCYIKKTNIASLKAASNCGFHIIGNAEIRGILRKLYLVDKDMGAFYIVKYINEDCDMN